MSFSRPSPLSSKPPKGIPGPTTRWSSIPTVPAHTRAATWCPRWMSTRAVRSHSPAAAALLSVRTCSTRRRDALLTELITDGDYHGSMETDLPKAAGRLFLRLQREMFRQVAEAGFDDVRPRHGAVLAYLVPEGRRLSEFAELSGQHKQVIGTIADELEALGYVTRVPDPTDGRAKLLVPTERGRAEVAASTRIIAGLEAGIAEAIGADRLAELRRDLMRASTAF